MWIHLSKDRITVNKVAAVDAPLRNVEPSYPRVALNESVSIEKVQAAVAIYILR